MASHHKKMSQKKATRVSNPDFDAVCHWYQVEFALYCFEVVRDTIEVILKKKLGERDLEYYAMTVGLICTYARPFTNNRPVEKLDADIVPQEFK
jgi:hypothetical protein